MKILDKPFDIPSVPPQFVQQFLGCFVREEAIEVVLLPREEGIQVYLSLLLFFDRRLWDLIVFFVHETLSILG